MVGWGIIGCGDVTEVKSGPPLSRVPGSRLVHVMRRSGGLAEDYARRHGVPRWSTDAAAVVADPEVTAVYIATLPDSHLDYVRMAAAAGKHVLVEKPMGRSFAECEQMIAATDAAGVKLWVAYYRRALPRFVAVRDAIAAGELGEVTSVQTTWHNADTIDRTAWRWEAANNPGGVFAETACHTLDFLDYLFGPMTDVAGHLADDLSVAVASYRFDGAGGGILGSGTWHLGAPDTVDATVITGSRASLTFATFSPTPIRITRGHETTELPIGDPPHVHEPLIESIVAELNGGPVAPSTGASGARTNRVLDTIIG